MDRISAHITYREATTSQMAERMGIDNAPSAVDLLRMRSTALHLFEPARRYFGTPIRVSSFYRSKVLNALIGGSARSQHCSGEAMDLDIAAYSGNTNAQLFHYYRQAHVFDQLIWEFGDVDEPSWVHVSQVMDGCNRGQVLRAMRGSDHRVHYVPWQAVRQLGS